MNVLQRLTLRHLRLNRKRTLITIVGILLSVAMVTAVSGMVVSTQDLLYRESLIDEGPWHVRYSGLTDRQIEQIAAEPVFSWWEVIPTEEDGAVLSLQFGRLHRGIFDESEAVCDKYGLSADQVRYHTDLLIAKGIVPGAYHPALYSFAGILLILIGVGSVLVISNAFAISSDGRSLQFGLLKSTGATGRQIRGMVFFEGFLLALVAIPIGMVVGLFAQWVALSIANRILAPMVTVSLSTMFRVIVSPAALCITVLAALATVFLSAYLPARRAGKISAIEAVRQNRTIKLSQKDVRVSPLTRKLFGFEGTLAAKAMGRSRSKYRATVLALVVSIVLFVGVSSFSNILIKATSMIYDDTGSNVLISLRGGSAEQNDRIVADLSRWEGVQIRPGRSLSGSVDLPETSLSEAYRQYFPEDTPFLRLFSIGDEAYRELCAKLRVQPQGSAESGALTGILVNTSGTVIQQGRRINFVPYRSLAGGPFAAEVEGQTFDLTVAGTTSEVLPGIYARFYAPAFNVIISDADMARLWPDEEDAMWIAAMAYDADGFEERAIQYFAQLPDVNPIISNYEQMAANSRNISTLVMIFVYGFIAMLTLIGVTSVIATISTNIALRTREFAMLRSAGMTEPSISKMLGYESLLYGVKALLWGLPIGVLVCYLLHRAMTSAMDFPFALPVASILISVVAVFLLTFMTMAFARRKLRQVNIVAALRDDVI